MTTLTANLRNKIKVRRTVQLSLSAEDWQLFTNSMDCRDAALGINTGVALAINGAETRREAEKGAFAVLSNYADFGAADSEPLWILEAVLDHVFGEE